MSRGDLTVRGFAVLAAAGILAFGGCDPGPPDYKPPVLDPQAAANAALAEYDVNKDQALDAAELAKVPGIAANLKLYDTDSDGKVSGNEITARLNKLVEQRIALTNISFQVTLDGNPLEGAVVTLVPEKYFGEAFKPATATTDGLGMATPSIAAGDLGPMEQSLSGVRVATYKVEITHPMFTLPARYNTATELGLEAALDTFGRETLVFALKSK